MSLYLDILGTLLVLSLNFQNETFAYYSTLDYLGRLNVDVRNVGRCCHNFLLC